MIIWIVLDIIGSGGGGSGEIRTHEGRKPLAVFKTAAFNHSATLPTKIEVRIIAEAGALAKSGGRFGGQRDRPGAVRVCRSEERRVGKEC